MSGPKGVLALNGRPIEGAGWSPTESKSRKIGGQSGGFCVQKKKL
jgi:hypothetical protein